MKFGSLLAKIDWVVLALVFLIFAPRLLAPAVFLTADEILFLDQTRSFAHGLASGDLSQTLGIGYPGVTVAAWSAPVVAGADHELAAYAAGRLVTALMTGLLLVVMYRFAHLLLGRWPAVLGVGLLALDPYTLAYSRLFHIEAPLALFMTLAGLACLLWLRDAGWRWLFLAGLFTGLALLTKSTALLLGPLLFSLMVGWRIAMTGWQKPATRFKERAYHVPASSGLTRYTSNFIFRALLALLAITLVAAVTFCLLWPAMWSQPAQALALTFSKLLTDREAGAGNLGLFWLGRFVEDPGPAFYPVAFLLKATPWLLVGLGLSLWSLLGNRLPQLLHRKNTGQPAVTWAIVLSLWLFTLVYLVFMTVASKKSIRYLLPAFPSLYLLAGLAIYQTVAGWRVGRPRETKSFLSWPFLHSSNSFVCQFSIGLLSLLLLLFTFFYHPYYFTYYNPVVLGWRWAPRAILVGWGEGLDEAARYLNRQPGGVVSAWYDWLLPPFYHGPVKAVVPPENLLTADQVVLYINQVQRDIPDPNLVEYFRTRRQPSYTARLAGIDYAWVYPGPVVGARSDPQPHYPLGGDFGGEVRLLGYDLSPDRAVSGQSLIVTLYWRVLARPGAERFVYVRLVDEQGHIWARADSPPVMGFWPSTRWQPGMLIEDAQAVPVPPGTPPGTYHLEIGLYDPASGQVLAAGGQPVGQGGGLLLGQVQLAWQAHRAEPDLPNRAEARLAPNARLVGYDSPPAAATTGDLLPIRLAWREATTLFTLAATPNNYVRFAWSRPGQAGGRPAEQLDALPWPIEQWGRGALLLSWHDVLVPPELAPGRYELRVSLHTGSDPAGEAFDLGMVEVSSPPHQLELPPNVLPPAGPGQLAGDIRLVGYDLKLSPNDAPQVVDLKLYWQTRGALTTRYKVFAQLLDANNTLVAQADSFPAAGQRPTTGWLPGEIIADAHTLALPAGMPAGNYRLVAGLYNPLSGERLPVAGSEAHHSMFPDAVFISEIQLP